MTVTTRQSKRRWSTIIWGAIPVALLATALTVDHVPFTDIELTVPYAAQGPGPTVNTLDDIDGKPVVDIEGAETDQTDGNLNMTTVAVRTNLTLPQALGRWIGSGDDLVPIEQVIPHDVSQEQYEQMNESAFVSSEASATVAAMKYLGRPTTVVVYDVVSGSAADGRLQAGDMITSVAGATVDEPGEVQDDINSRKPGDSVQLGVERDGSPITVNVDLGENSDKPGTAQLGILMTSEPADGVKVTYNLSDIGGPSAGMMFSLAVIDKLSPGELNGGHFVAGTGTIDDDGTVGPIGGITHKITAARDAGAELFLAPADNCDEVRTAKTGDMVVARVATLDDAVSAMQNFSAGRDVASCS